MWLFAVRHQMLKAKVNPLLAIFLPSLGRNALRIEGKHPCPIEKESPKLQASIGMLKAVSLNSCEAFTSRPIRAPYPMSNLTFFSLFAERNASVITRTKMAGMLGERLWVVSAQVP